jgi:hypothetical protein
MLDLKGYARAKIVHVTLFKVKLAVLRQIINEFASEYPTIAIVRLLIYTSRGFEILPFTQIQIDIMVVLGFIDYILAQMTQATVVPVLQRIVVLEAFVSDVDDCGAPMTVVDVDGYQDLIQFQNIHIGFLAPSLDTIIIVRFSGSALLANELCVEEGAGGNAQAKKAKAKKQLSTLLMAIEAI